MNTPIFDPELVRSLSRMIYGHETWLENARFENGKVVIDGMYGHRLENDRAMPLNYANIAIFDGKGYYDADYDLSEEENCRRLRFTDNGSDSYTVYYSSCNIPWVQNDEGWSMGVKRDFDNVKYSAAYNLTAKKIMSRTGEMGNVVNTDLDIVPDTAVPVVGKPLGFTVFYEGKPLPHVKTKVLRKGAEDFIDRETDVEGRATVPVDTPGTYMILARFADPSKAVEDEYDEAVYCTTITLEAD